MHNRTIYNNFPENVKTQIYGLDPNVPISILQDGSIPISLPLNLENGSLPVSLSGDGFVQISGVPTVIISGTVNFDGTPTVLIGEPVVVTGVLDLAAGAAVSISGTPTVLIDQPVAVTGALDLATGAAVSISGTPTVLIGNALTLSGIPTVAISGLVSVTIPQSVSVNLSSRLFTSVSAIVTVTQGTTAYFPSTNAFDVSELSDYSYFIGWLLTTVSGTMVLQPQIAPAINTAYGDLFVPANSSVTIVQGQRVHVTDTKYFEYSRLALSLSAPAGSSVTVLAYFQGVK